MCVHSCVCSYGTFQSMDRWRDWETCLLARALRRLVCMSVSLVFVCLSSHGWEHKSTSVCWIHLCPVCTSHEVMCMCLGCWRASACAGKRAVTPSLGVFITSLQLWPWQGAQTGHITNCLCGCVSVLWRFFFFFLLKSQHGTFRFFKPHSKFLV